VEKVTPKMSPSNSSVCALFFVVSLIVIANTPNLIMAGLLSVAGIFVGMGVRSGEKTIEPQGGLSFLFRLSEAPASGLICPRAALSHFPHPAILPNGLWSRALNGILSDLASRCHLPAHPGDPVWLSAVSFWSFSRRSSTIASSRAATNDGRSFSSH
jgi:hypothetical protein